MPNKVSINLFIFKNHKKAMHRFLGFFLFKGPKIYSIIDYRQFNLYKTL